MRTRLGLAAAVLLLAGLAVPATAAPAPPTGSSPDGPAAPPAAQLQEVDGELTRSYSVPTRHGTLYLEVVHPTLGGEIVPAHGILTLSPYSALGRNGDAEDWVPRGYARMYADVVGTGNSGGCYDYGGHREQETGHDLVEWVAAQPWSHGRVGMIGGSYDGTTATATAVTRPEGLATIVPEAAISRWYDYAYSGGMRYFLGNEALGHQGPGAVTDEGFDTPFAFDFGLAVPPPLDVESADWKDRFADNVRVCEELEHTERGYDTTPTYDAFWARRDYAAQADQVTIPVLVAHNWGDWNVKQDTAYRLFDALTNSKHKRLFFGTRWEGHGTPGGSYQDTTLAWMDRWVGGVRNGIERSLPTVVSQTSSSEGAGDFVWGRAPRTTPVTLSSTADGALAAGATEPGTSASIPFSLAGTESAALAELDAPPGSGYVVLQSPPLAEDVRIFGSPTIDVTLSTGRSWTTLAPAVVDVDPAARSGGLATDPGAAVAVTRGWLDTRYAGGLDRLRADEDGDGVLRASVDAKPMDWTFPAGHRIALVVQTSSLEWALPKAYDGACPSCASWSLGLGPETSVTLPVVGKPDQARLFATEE